MRYNRSRKPFWLAFLLALLLCTRSPEARAIQGEKEIQKDRIIAGYGMFTDTTYHQIMTAGRTRYQNSWISFLAFNRSLNGELLPFRFEAEGQYVQHSGIQSHPEINGALIARLENPYLFPASFAFGAGASYAAGRPELEFPRRNALTGHFREQEEKRLLNYILTEVDVGIPGTNARALMRVHHRSGIFGAYCLPICGSNYIAYGVKAPLSY